MSVAEDYGISEVEWEKLGAEVQQKLIEGQAKLIANQQLLNNQIMEDDDRDLRRRSHAVTADILGRDTHSCEDPGYEVEPENDMRITILGDINSEETFKSILQNRQRSETTEQPATEQPSTEQPPAEQPAPEKKKTPWWGKLLGTLGAVALGAGITFGAAKYFSGDSNQYDIRGQFRTPPHLLQNEQES